jgi:hypothetical protein
LFSSGFANKALLLSHACHIPCLSHPPWLDHPN